MNELLSYGQMSFGWEEPHQNGEPDVFYAILVEDPINALLASHAESYRRELESQGPLTPKRHMHITLVSLGDGKPGVLIDIALHIGSLIQAKPFDVCLDRLSAFGGGARCFAAVTVHQRCKPSGQPHCGDR